MAYEVMTVDHWVTKARENQDKLRDLIASYHPSARQPAAYRKQAVLLTDGDVVEIDAEPFPITAPNAELACRDIRQQIRAEEPTDPLARWDKAVANSDISEMMDLLNGAWFGVPESTLCWRIRGFSEAVELLEDPPAEPEGEGNYDNCK